jgi:hypothetical protein
LHVNELNNKIEQLKQLDVEMLALCNVDDIVQEINETEETFSRICDIRHEMHEVTKLSVAIETTEENQMISGTHKEEKMK